MPAVLNEPFTAGGEAGSAALVDEADVSRTPAPRGYAAAPPRPAGP
jgi:hypothetical protein